MWKYTKRSSFILLEVFIALSLLCLALHSLISIPSICFHKELRILNDLEITRLEDIAYIELLEKLPQVLPLESVKEGKKGRRKYRIDLAPQAIHLGKGASRTYRPYATLWVQKESGNVQLLKCNIMFDPYIKKIRSNKKFIYKIIAYEKAQKKTHNLN